MTGHIITMLPVAFICLLIQGALSVEWFGGRCPSIDAMKDLDMERFEGRWYVWEVFEDREKCMTWDIEKGDSPDTWKIYENKESGALHKVGIKNSMLRQGTITMSDKENHGKLRLYRNSAAFAGDAALTIQTTDYDNYAAAFECQNVVFFSRHNGIALSRTPIMKPEYRTLGRVLSSHVNMDYYQRVQQGNCHYREDPNEDKESQELIGNDGDTFLSDEDIPDLGLPRPVQERPGNPRA